MTQLNEIERIQVGLDGATRRLNTLARNIPVSYVARRLRNALEQVRAACDPPYPAVPTPETVHNLTHDLSVTLRRLARVLETSVE